MSKRPLGGDGNSKPIQTGIPANTQKENTVQVIEMATEQLVDLLWKHWFLRKDLNRKKQTKSE